MNTTFRSIMHTWNGQVVVQERPVPACRDHFVLVDNRFSTMSPGTHCGILRDLRQRQDPAAGSFTLGYTGAGVVREVGRGVTTVVPGDRVAIYGSPFAFEGEVCLVPRLLCHRIPDEVSLEEASSVGLGVIAMHAVRRAQVEMGSRVLVVGLGVLGLLACQYVQRCGGFLVACDRDAQRRIRLAAELAPGARVFSTKDCSITDAVHAEFGDAKLDSAIIFVSGAQEVGAEVSRNVRGRGTIVLGGGDIGLGPGNATGMEQTIIGSRAGGPGRGMSVYEEEGRDFPIEYVRFTEGRNMEAYIGMLRRRWIAVRPLIDRTYAIDEAPAVYERMLAGTCDDIAPLFRFGG
jgi:NADPH:quinone reductase-like Zn-dependent oxidoreductase